MHHLAAVVAFVALLAGGCRAARDPNAPIATPDENHVRIRAATDLDCAQEDILVTPGENRRFVAKGCGNEQTYRISCTSTRQNPTEHCSAMSLSPGESDGDEVVDETKDE